MVMTFTFALSLGVDSCANQNGMTKEPWGLCQPPYTRIRLHLGHLHATSGEQRDVENGAFEVLVRLHKHAPV
eukprot:2117702-Pyramimonas_sp.AAC.1